MLLQNVVAGAVFFFLFIVGHAMLGWCWGRCYDGAALPGPLRFPVPELACFWIYAPGALQSGFTVALLPDPTAPWKVAGAALVLFVVAVFGWVILLVLNPVARNRLISWKTRQRLSTMVSPGRRKSMDGGGAPPKAEFDPFYVPERKSERDDGAVVFVLAERGVADSKGRWSKAFSDPQHAKGEWRAVEGSHVSPRGQFGRIKSWRRSRGGRPRLCDADSPWRRVAATPRVPRG